MLKNIFSFLMACAFVFAANYIFAQSEKIEAEVMYCSDGDTCHVKVRGLLWMNVRLAGIDAPETEKKRQKKSAQPIGQEAKDFLNLSVKGKKVMLHQTDLDPFNRPLVEVYLGEKLVNLEMVEKGFAEAYRGKAKRINRLMYLQAEEKAKSLKIGIWGLQNYESPSDFRKKK